MDFFETITYAMLLVPSLGNHVGIVRVPFKPPVVSGNYGTKGFKVVHMWGSQSKFLMP